MEKNYPEIYYSDEVNDLLSFKPQIPNPPNEPVKPMIVPDPGEYDSGGNRGCFLFAFIAAVIGFIAILSSDMDKKAEIILPGIALIALLFFMFKTTTWDKESNDKKREEHRQSLSTFSERESKYKIELARYQEELEEYNENVALLKSDTYIRKIRRKQIAKWAKDRIEPDFEDCEEDEKVKKGVSELFFYSELRDGLESDVEIYNNKRIPVHDTFFYPDILLIFNNIYVDIEIDEPYAGNDGTPIHYIDIDKYGFRSNIDEDRNEFMNKMGFEVIRFSEEQVFLYTDECITYLINFINGIIDANQAIECDDDFFVRKWTKEEATKMAYKRFRNTYVPKKFIKLIDKEEHQSYEEMRNEFENDYD